MFVFSTVRLGVLALLLISCSKAEEKSQEISSESFRNEVAATEVRIASAERKSFDYLINTLFEIYFGILIPSFSLSKNL